jgi:hypothetical protein
VLLDFTAGGEDAATPYIGDAIREECGVGEGIRSIAVVPSRSLLSRLTDHYLQIVANRAPVGFEAEFVNQRCENICYRGIMMPFSSDGDTIDFIYGVINWKKVGETAEDGAQVPFQPQAWTDEEQPAMPILAVDELAGKLPDPAEESTAEALELGVDEGLGDRLWTARANAKAAKFAEGRSRTALYAALSHAYDFALASKHDPDVYAELLEDSGVKPQARAPMTPIVKLVFGVDYDKARLTEFAAALAYAERQQVGFGGFMALIEGQAGGLKALVAAERQARRPEPNADTRTEVARSKLRTLAPLPAVESGEEFAVAVTRRGADGSHEIVAMVDDPALVERAIRRAAA